MEAGYLSGDYETCKFAHRRWVIDDGTPHGRLLWTQRSEAATNNWGNLWRSLRHQVPDEIYRSGASVTSIVEAADEVTITTSNGETASYDALIGADGYRSRVRAMLVPESTPSFAGYVLWRGNYEEDRLEDRSLVDIVDVDDSWFTVVFPGGHGVFYMIPGFGNRADAGHRRVNWAIHAPSP